MRIELPRESERFGAAIFNGVQKVYELDSGLSVPEPQNARSPIECLPYERLFDVHARMAVVVPVKGERIRVIEGVLFGIPHHCLTIVVSNSPRAPVDRFRIEQQAIGNYARYTSKNIVLVHQKDPVLARALVLAGYDELIGEDGLVRDGKAEGMMLGILLARLAGKLYVGFVDSDNLIPGSVHEYVSAFGAGFALMHSPYGMVRILWHSKPKVRWGSDHLFFARYGRSSVITNRFLNRLLGWYSGFETEVIRTGNAGEHALTMELALRLNHASGYAVETNQLVALLERFGGVRESPYPEVMRDQVEVCQIESRNPHLHQSRGDAHVAAMIEASLSVVYHSWVCPEDVRAEIMTELAAQGVCDGVPARRRYYPSLDTLDLRAFEAAITTWPASEILVPAGG